MTTFGDINIDAQAFVNVENVNANVESLLSITTQFNPMTFAVSSAISIVSSIFSANKQREYYEQQIAMLREIKQSLDELHEKADKILEILDNLPSIIQGIVRDEVLFGRMDTSIAYIENEILTFIHNDDYKCDIDTWNRLKSSYYEICAYEVRWSRLARLVQITEFMNVISAGQSEEYFRIRLNIAIDRLRTLMTSYAKDITNTYTSWLQIVCDYFNKFMSRPIDGQLLMPELGAVKYIHVPRFPSELLIGKNTGEIDDIVYTESVPISHDFLRTAFLEARVESITGSVNVNEWESKCRVSDNSPLPPSNWECTIVNTGRELFVSRISTWRADAQELLRTFTTYGLDPVREKITRFRELQVLRQQLEKVRDTHYAEVLKNSAYRITDERGNIR